ncbi:MAG: winged helix-turn-helix domain-containing protein [Pyrinomonadaceae bacterium]
MTNDNGRSYDFGVFHLDVSQRMLFREGEVVRLPAKALELLTYFVEHPNQVINKEVLMQEIWQNSFVEDVNLSVHVSTLRKILTTGGDASARIETFPKKGYRLSAEVRPTAPVSAEPEVLVEPVPERRAAVSSRKWLWPVLIGGALLLLSILAVWRWFVQAPPPQPTLLRLNGMDQSSSKVISPNGEYIAHAISDAGMRTLMLEHLKSGSSSQMLPADPAHFLGMAFSKDSSFLYFVKEAVDGGTSLFRMPLLGTSATRILDNISNNLSFSPDGDRFCFVRKPPDKSSVIMIANSDGTGERVVARRESPDYFSGYSIAWSPDGKTIAIAAGRSRVPRSLQIIGVDVDTGAEHPITEQNWSGDDGLQWLPNNSGLAAALYELGGSPTHIWHVPVPTGSARKITNDLHNYGISGITSDGQTLLADQFTDVHSLWIIPGDNPAGAKPIPAAGHHNFRWARWMADGRLLFGSSAGQIRDIWTINADGGSERSITGDASANVMPVATNDGQYLVFGSTRGGSSAFHLWRTDIDGNAPLQLTHGSEETQPDTTPDGRWIFYTSGLTEEPAEKKRVWKVSIDGGEPTPFIDMPSYLPDVSPDGKFVLCWYKPDERTPWQVAIFSIEGGQPLKLFSVQSGTPVRWTPDGKGFSYIKTTADDVSNIWTQSVEGGQPKQITQFTSETIFNFDWSEDNRLVCSRYSKKHEAILIRNFN